MPLRRRLLGPAERHGSDENQYCQYGAENSHQSPSYLTPRCSSASDGQPFHSAIALFPRYCRSSTPILLVQKPLAVRSRKLLKKAAPWASAGSTFPGYARSSSTRLRSTSVHSMKDLSNRVSHK